MIAYKRGGNSQGRASARPGNFLQRAVLVWCVCFGPRYGQAQQVAWATAIGGAGYEEARGIAVAQDGRIYVTGEFEGTADFAAGDEVSTKTSAGLSDAFLACYTNNGRLDHVVAFAGLAKSQGYGVALAPNGTVYTTGIFTGTVDLDPGPGTAAFTSGGLYDAYLCALDPEGNLLWAGAIGGPGNEETRSVTTDAAGNLYIAGEMHGAFDADPGPGVHTVGELGSFDAFVAKYTPDGTLLWAHALGGPGDDRAYDAVTRPDGGVCVTGYFAGSVDLDPGPDSLIVSAPGQWSDAFLVCYAADGGLLWGTAMGGVGTDIGRGLALDAAGNVAITGRFARTAYFPHALGMDSVVCAGPTGDADLFLAKYDGSGGLLWVKSVGGPEENMPRGVATDREGNILVTGRTRGTVDLDPGVGEAMHTANGEFDAFLGKYDPQGEFIWGFTAGGTFHTRGLNVATDAVGSAYLTGWLSLPMDVDPGADTLLLVSHGGVDAYVAKFSDHGLHDLDLAVQLDDEPMATGWTLSGQPAAGVLFGGVATASETGQAIHRRWQVPDGCYRLAVTDAEGDGINAGGYTLSTDSLPLIVATGAFEAESTLANGEQFCLPMGPATLEPAACSQGTFGLGDALVIGPVPGTTQYSVWVFDPHGTFSGTVEVGSTMVYMFQLPPGTPNGVPLNVRVRAWVGGVPMPYGPACVVQFDGLTEVVQPVGPGPSLRLQPNPTCDGAVLVAAPGLSDGAWLVVVHDALGRELLHSNMGFATGRTTLHLPVEGLSNGLYTVLVNGPDGPLVQQLLIAR